ACRSNWWGNESARNFAPRLQSSERLNYASTVTCIWRQSAVASGGASSRLVSGCAKKGRRRKSPAAKRKTDNRRTHYWPSADPSGVAGEMTKQREFALSLVPGPPSQKSTVSLNAEPAVADEWARTPPI